MASYDDSNHAYPNTAASSADSHTQFSSNGGEQRSLLNGATTDSIDSPGYFYSSPSNTGLGSRRSGSRVASTTGRSTGVPALSEKLNPRGGSAMYTGSTLLGSGQGSRGGYKDGISGKEMYAIDANPFSWDIKDGQPESDDYLHDPKDEGTGSWTSDGFPTRALCNVGALILLACGLLALFAGYPIISALTKDTTSTKGGFSLGGTNASGQVAAFTGMRTGLIDADTPASELTRVSDIDGSTYNLVFSDEFNVDGRSFYPNDDPFWEAVDLHYWGTNNYEWYDPAGVTTSGGALQITLSQHPEHNLNFRGGMLQSWNKMCFTGGYVVASVRLPGYADVAGLWPAFWLMGNLGRAGYGATLEGTWPYSYETCDVGTLQNQTTVDGLPAAAAYGGSVGFNKKHHSNALSFLAGQRLSSCTCPDDDHPGPKMSNGSYVGRAAPEIDIFEAQVSSAGKMTVSQSGQWAPFNQYYEVTNTTGPAYEFQQSSGVFNVYTGEITQQSTSGVTDTPQGAVEKGGTGAFAEYGLEYQPGDDGYIQWYSGGNPSWQLYNAAMEPDPVSLIARRPFPVEPMYIIFNLGISENFGTPIWDELTWPNTMSVDWVRVYQKEGQENVGCDPADYPTADYINRHMEAYTNANLTLWGGTADEGGYGAYWPRNRLNPDGCDADMSLYPGSPTVNKAKATYRASSVATYWEIPDDA